MGRHGGLPLRFLDTLRIIGVSQIKAPALTGTGAAIDPAVPPWFPDRLSPYRSPRSPDYVQASSGRPANEGRLRRSLLGGRGLPPPQSSPACGGGGKPVRSAAREGFSSGRLASALTVRPAYGGPHQTRWATVSRYSSPSQPFRRLVKGCPRSAQATKPETPRRYVKVSLWCTPCQG